MMRLRRQYENEEKKKILLLNNPKGEGSKGWIKEE